ncbi:MAG: dTDP-4-dehydrorhamnose 3,5-epimerase [Endomicrobia bacterium]|nr:dTDP-4-dehydrorhamnose 3,5-epimerase [Endomicrobiia bacterium]MCL2799008.1 dTDP-4-dehydrorhamnose 3,5-epimerase [Endomicrobiia bacterium]
MVFKELPIKGAFVIEPDKYKDHRGSFFRFFCKRDLTLHDISFNVKQCNMSKNNSAGVLRGLHYQKEPFTEQKIVSCMKGSSYNVIVDIRKDSPTYLKWTHVVLSEKNEASIYIPPMCAHGFQTLEDDTVLFYILSEFFMPDYYAGIRWNDPKIGIKWPDRKNVIINEKDKNHELL